MEPGLTAALGAGLLLAIITACMLLGSATLRLSWHGLLHASIVYELMDGCVPPENPFFAGQPLGYYWFYHLCAAGVSRACALSPLYAFSAFNIFAVGAVMPCLYLAGRRLRLSQSAALLGSALGMLALNPLGPLFFMLQEPDITFQALETGLNPTHLLQHLALGFDFRLASGLTKFWNVSSFAPAIALFALAMTAGFAGFKAGWRSALLLAASVFSILLMNPLAALCLLVPLGAAALMAVKQTGIKELGWTVGALLLGCVLASPGIAQVMGAAGGKGIMGFSFSGKALLGVALAAGPLLLLAAFGAIQALRQKRAELTALAVFCTCLLVMALIMTFPEGNEYKIIRLLIYPAGLLAGVPALAFLKRLRLHWSLLGVGAALVILPSSAMALIAYLHAAQGHALILEKGDQILLIDGQDDRKEAYRILREETPPDAVVVVNPEDRVRAVGGYMQGDEVPALARRALYTGYAFYLTGNCPGFEDRLARSAALFSGQDYPLPQPVSGRPLYVLVRAGQAPPRLEQSGFHRIFKGNNCSLYQVAPTRGDGHE